MANQIHETALVHPEAKLGDNIEVGPYSVVGPNVELGNHCKLHSHVVIEGHTTVGEYNEFYQFSSIGAAPQDTSYKGEPTRVEIGDRNIFREYVSIHRGTLKENEVTSVGSHNLLMAYVHLGHDVALGSHCVFANSTNLAGHVKVGDRVIIGGGTNISQFCKLGRGAYIGGATAIDRDIPIFSTATGNRARLKGINIIGLRRQGYAKKDISGLLDFFRTMEESILSPKAFVDHDEFMEDYVGNELVAEMAEGIKTTEIGIAPFIRS